MGIVRLIRLRGRERFALAAALVASALLVALAGGPISDALLGRGGTAGSMRVAWEPVARELLPFQQADPSLVEVGIIPLVAIGAFAAYRKRSWGLGFLTAAGVFGLLEAELLQSQLEWHDGRIHWLALAVAMIGALAGVGALVGALRGEGRRRLAVVTVVLLVFLPIGLPRAVSGTHLVLRDLQVVDPAVDDSGRHYRDRTFVGERLAANWELYAWMQRSLPTDARLLALLPDARVSATAAGVASPLSHRDYQMLLFGYTTWVYEDALRFLQRDDLAAMGITHLHATDALVANLQPSAKRLLDDSSHFRLLADIQTNSGTRHRVFQVMPGAGATAIAPTSYRALRRLVPPNAPVATLGSMQHGQRMIVMSAFADHEDLQSSIPLRFERATRIPRVETPADVPTRGVTILRDHLEPTALGVSRAAATWTGHGLRAYDLAAGWSPVWRIGHDPAALPGPQRAFCESSSDGQVDLRLLGEPGAAVTAGSTEVILTGLPQVTQLTVPDCGALNLRADAAVAPFAQIRPRHTGRPVGPVAPIAGLGFDGGVNGEHAIINLWYRNPRGVPFVTGTEFRLYEASPLGVGLSDSNPNPRAASLRWWPGPIALYAPEQTARIEFDARRLEMNGDGAAAQPLSSLRAGPICSRSPLRASTRALATWRSSTLSPWHAWYSARPASTTRCFPASSPSSTMRPARARNRRAMTAGFRRTPFSRRASRPPATGDTPHPCLRPQGEKGPGHPSRDARFLGSPLSSCLRSTSRSVVCSTERESNNPTVVPFKFPPDPYGAGSGGVAQR